MEVHDVVTKLIGSIKPLGETNEDTKRFENLTKMTDLITKLVADVDSVSDYSGCSAYSRAKAGKKAVEFLIDLKDSIGTPIQVRL